MTEHEWHVAPFADLWENVGFTPPTRKSDLLGIACARPFWESIDPNVWAELRQIELRADDPSERMEDLDVLDDGSGTSWLLQLDDADLDGSLGRTD